MNYWHFDWHTFITNYFVQTDKINKNKTKMHDKIKI